VRQCRQSRGLGHAYVARVDGALQQKLVGRPLASLSGRPDGACRERRDGGGFGFKHAPRLVSPVHGRVLGGLHARAGGARTPPRPGRLARAGRALAAIGHGDGLCGRPDTC
jgi:hypothetical protein